MQLVKNTLILSILGLILVSGQQEATATGSGFGAGIGLSLDGIDSAVNNTAGAGGLDNSTPALSDNTTAPSDNSSTTTVVVFPDDSASSSSFTNNSSDGLDILIPTNSSTDIVINNETNQQNNSTSEGQNNTDNATINNNNSANANNTDSSEQTSAQNQTQNDNNNNNNSDNTTSGAFATGGGQLDSVTVSDSGDSGQINTGGSQQQQQHSQNNSQTDMLPDNILIIDNNNSAQSQLQNQTSITDNKSNNNDSSCVDVGGVMSNGSTIVIRSSNGGDIVMKQNTITQTTTTTITTTQSETTTTISNTKEGGDVIIYLPISSGYTINIPINQTVCDTNDTQQNSTGIDGAQNNTDNTTTIQVLPPIIEPPENQTNTNTTTEPEIIPPQDFPYGEEYIYSVSQLAQSLSGSASPQGVSQNINDAFQNILTNGYKSLIDLQNITRLENVTEDMNITQYFKIIENAYLRVFWEVDRSLAVLFRNKNQDQCYYSFVSSVSEINFYWNKLVQQVTKQQKGLGAILQTQSFQEFCDTGLDSFTLRVQSFAKYILGSDTGNCKIIQTLYDGHLENNIWVGWRDNINEKAGFLVMQLAKGVGLINACANSDDQELAAFETNIMLVDTIMSIQKLDSYVRQSLQQTISQNLYYMLSISQGLSYQTLAINTNLYFLSVIYDDYLWQMGVVSSSYNQTSFESECWNCATFISGDYYVEVSWLPKTSISSLYNVQPYQKILVNLLNDVNMTNDKVSELVWNANGCTSGMWMFNKMEGNQTLESQYYVNTQFYDRMLIMRVDELRDVYVWGTIDFCYGKPNSIAI